MNNDKFCLYNTQSKNTKYKSNYWKQSETTMWPRVVDTPGMWSQRTWG